MTVQNNAREETAVTIDFIVTEETTVIVETI